MCLKQYSTCKKIIFIIAFTNDLLVHSMVVPFSIQMPCMFNGATETCTLQRIKQKKCTFDDYHCLIKGLKRESLISSFYGLQKTKSVAWKPITSLIVACKWNILKGRFYVFFLNMGYWIQWMLLVWYNDKTVKKPASYNSYCTTFIRDVLGLK